MNIIYLFSSLNLLLYLIQGQIYIKLPFNIAERVEEANAPELTNAVFKYAKVSTFSTGKPVATDEKNVVPKVDFSGFV